MTTTTAPILPRLIEIIREELADHRSDMPDITADSAFEADLLCDPLDMLCILQRVEETWRDLPDVEFETVADLARLVEGV